MISDLNYDRNIRDFVRILANFSCCVSDRIIPGFRDLIKKKF